MNIRGAPLIAMVAILGLAVELQQQSKETITKAAVYEKMDFLATSRPTAVNLFNALHELRTKLDGLEDDTRIVETVAEYGKWMLARDTHDCLAIGEYGAQAIVEQNANTTTQKLVIMTICNTGALACSQHGTALGVLRSLHIHNQKLERAIVLETRPYNQGSRLKSL